MCFALSVPPPTATALGRRSGHGRGLLDAAPVHQLSNRGRDARYHRLFAIDQRRPVEARLADVGVVCLGALELVERECRRDQHFFGMQPRLGQVPPSRSGGIIATVCPASRVATVTPIPALPPARITTSKLRVGIAWSSLKAYCQGGRCRGRGQPFPVHPCRLHALQLEECHGRRGKTDRAIGAGT
jgi:hypothetical protein